MQVHALARKVTSKTHVRSSSSSSKLNHSWAVAGDGGMPLPLVAITGIRLPLPLPTAKCLAEPAQLDHQLARGQQTFPELAHHHAFVRRVVSVVGQGDAEVE